MKLKAITLIELVLVMVVSGLLITMGVINYQNTIRNGVFKEARSSIELIVMAEKVYRGKEEVYGSATLGSYGECANTSDCITKLNLDFHPSGDWDYDVSASGSDVDITATYVGSRTDITSCTATLQDGGDATGITCN